MTYSKPELLLVGAAERIVLGGDFAAAYDNATGDLSFTDPGAW
jgi:hypothetical protein